MTLQDLNKNYIYQGDKSLDSWQEMKPDKDGKYKGDCEDYCITIKKNIPEFKDWDYYYCKLEATGHCVLYKDDKVIDCNSRCILAFDTYCKSYKAEGFKKYCKFTVMCKMLVGRLISLLKST